MAAAWLGVVVQEGIRCFAQPDPAAVLAGINQMLLERGPQDMFVTAACVVIDSCDGSAAAAVAGHPPPRYWDHAQGRPMVVSDHGPARGLGPGWGNPTVRWRLAPRDTLILYTGGVLDAKLNQTTRLGEARLAELSGWSAPASAAEWVDRVGRALEECLELLDNVFAMVLFIECASSLRIAALPVRGKR